MAKIDLQQQISHLGDLNGVLTVTERSREMLEINAKSPRMHSSRAAQKQSSSHSG